MMPERALSAIQKAAGEFVNRESNRRSMITVTRVLMDRKGLRAEIYISVFPDKDTAAAVDFLNRKRDEFRRYIAKRVEMRALPRPIFLAEPNREGV